MEQSRLPTSEQGSTLSEVMVVVAIVGVLASIAGISYTVFSDKAKAVENLQKLLTVDPANEYATKTLKALKA